jgi:hypothetical protein
MMGPEPAGYANPAENPAFLEMLGQPLPSVEEVFAREVAANAAMLPIQIDEITMLTGVSAEGSTLHFIYEVSREIAGFRSDFHGILAERQCQILLFGSELWRGGTIVMTYRRPDGRAIETFVIAGADCGS